MIWRYEWPFAEGLHKFSVRSYDSKWQLQVTQENATFPSGATGIDEKRVDILPTKL